MVSRDRVYPDEDLRTRGNACEDSDTPTSLRSPTPAACYSTFDHVELAVHHKFIFISHRVPGSQEEKGQGAISRHGQKDVPHFSLDVARRFWGENQGEASAYQVFFPQRNTYSIHLVLVASRPQDDP